MSRELEQLLQECLAGLDSGLSPEECLSAWPQHRDDLEPMLRQAMLLRVAFARRPAADFQARAREKLMFAAGREVTAALGAEPAAAFVYQAREKLMFAAGREAARAFSAQPDERFVRRTRQRVLFAAGAATQESLRNVPPPRLAFWVMARRRLLESAVPGPAARQPAFSMTLAFRSLSAAAVLVLAIGVATLMVLSRATSPTVGAELAALEQQVREIEEQKRSGESVSPAILVELSRKTAAVAEKIEKSEPQSGLAAKAGTIIEKQKEFIQDASLAPAPEIAQARQQLDQADESVRVAAARLGTPASAAAPASQPPSTTAPSTASPPPATAAAASPTVRPPTPAPAGPGEVRTALLASDTTFGLTWSELTAQYFRVVVPASWTVVGVNFDSTGLGILGSRFIRIDGPSGIIVNIDPRSGEMLALVGGASLQLRSETGVSTSVDELVTKAGPYALELTHMLESVLHTPPTPTPTATPTATSTQSPASSPTTTPTP